MPKPKPPEPPAVIRISANTILDGQFYTRGAALPFTKVEDLPPNLQPLVVTGDELEEDEEPEGARGSYKLGEVYEVTPDDRLGRRLRSKAQREIAALQAQNEREEWLEEEVAAAGELPPEVAESLEEEHRRHVEMQRAQLDVDNRRADELTDSVIEAAEPPRLYVKRGSRHYAPALTARLKAGESVFTRQADGRFRFIGEVNGDLELPDLPIQL
jgi:hypothetical protein